MAKNESDDCAPFKVEGDKTFAYSPETNDYVSVKDVRDEWKRDAERYPTTKEQRRAFYQQRIRLLEDSGESAASKERMIEDLKQSLKDEESEEDGPIPAGLGYGAYYRDGALEFNDHSVLYFKIVSVPQIGNNKNEWLYLTSTNRAPKGLEAYLSYKSQDSPTFNVFDWTKHGKARFVISRPYHLLTDYLFSHQAGGEEYQVLSVMNATRKIAGNEWKNEALVYNPTTEGYDLIYASEYTLGPFEVNDYRSWGPIIEPFPPFPYSINKVGFFDAQLVQDGKPPMLLNNDVTYLREVPAGAQSSFNQPNYSFVVHW